MYKRVELYLKILLSKNGSDSTLVWIKEGWFKYMCMGNLFFIGSGFKDDIRTGEGPIHEGIPSTERNGPFWTW